MLALVACNAQAQRPECPLRDAPMPVRPPGRPPAVLPTTVFPDTFPGKAGEGVRVEMSPPIDIGDALIDAEDGHLSAVVRMAEAARSTASTDEAISKHVDIGKTGLADWRFMGYLPGEHKHQVRRAFSRLGSVLVFEQWHYSADGAQVFPLRKPNAVVGQSPATKSGLKAPSGCVSATLNWDREGWSYSLQVVGPLPLTEQWDLLLRLGSSIELVGLSGSR